MNGLWVVVLVLGELCEVGFDGRERRERGEGGTSEDVNDGEGGDIFPTREEERGVEEEMTTGKTNPLLS